MKQGFSDGEIVPPMINIDSKRMSASAATQLIQLAALNEVDWNTPTCNTTCNLNRAENDDFYSIVA